MSSVFYDEGLRFSCSRCSNCCGGGPGYVFLSKRDLRSLLAACGLDFPSFFSKYCRLVDTGMGMAISLSEKANYDCIFLGENGCAYYDARPIQCSTYPFWSGIVESREHWIAERAHCPGIGQGELWRRGSIEERLFDRRAAGTILLAYGEEPELMDADTILGR